MAWLNADVKDGVHMNFSVECFPAVATSKGVKTEDRAGRWPIKVL